LAESFRRMPAVYRCLLFLLLPAVALADFRVETVVEGLEHPWSLAFLPDGRLLVTERPGRLRLVEDRRLHPEPIAGVPAVFAHSQGGLLEVLADPAFADNGLVYLSFAHGDMRANATRVVRARLVGHTLAEIEILFTAEPWKRGPVHYGGRMAFLADGSLVIGLGDGFDYREAAQDPGSHLGTIVRIHADGSLPDDNPFVGREDALPEVWSYGHRNVQGLAVVGSQLFAHEHGPRGGDELNLILAAGNYGWPLASDGIDYSGAMVTPFARYPDTVAPLVEWTPSIAPAGLMIYGGGLFPRWQGDFFVTALAGKHLRRVRLDGRLQVVEQEVLLADLEERLRDVREGPEGAIWLTTDSAQGRVLRLVP
jgi:aldose sugar dehydrogenase